MPVCEELSNRTSGIKAKKQSSLYYKGKFDDEIDECER